MPENATPDESVQIIIPPDTVVDLDNPLPVVVVSDTATPQPVTIADGSDVAEGAKADAAWSGSGNGTVVAILKAIYAKVAATLGFSVNAGTTDATTLRVITASDGPLNTNLGTTTDAAVTTDANGSISSKIRGLVKLFNSVIGSAGSSATGVMSIQGIASGTAAPVSGTVTANLQPVTSGGSSIYRNLDAGTTGVRVKSGAGQIYGWFISNNAATARFVKLYDSNNNPPTSADTPVLTLQIPASGAANVAFPNGIAFASGIGIRASTGVADNDAGATVTNDVIVNLMYK